MSCMYLLYAVDVLCVVVGMCVVYVVCTCVIFVCMWCVCMLYVHMLFLYVCGVCVCVCMYVCVCRSEKLLDRQVEVLLEVVWERGSPGLDRLVEVLESSDKYETLGSQLREARERHGPLPDGKRES